MKILAGNSNLPLAKAIAGYLELPLTHADVRRFADDEVFVEIHENVRGEDVFVIQSTSAPCNDNLMELLICIDALRRASAARITAVVPYFGYARQDRKPGPRTPISAKLVANLITTAGADRVLAVDLHAGQIQGFFDIPTDNLFAAPVMAAVLTWVSTTGSALLGFLYLFTFSLGMCTLLVVVGLSAGSLSRLPRAGAWMLTVKKVFAFVMLGVAEYYLVEMGKLMF